MGRPLLPPLVIRPLFYPQSPLDCDISQYSIPTSEPMCFFLSRPVTITEWFLTLRIPLESSKMQRVPAIIGWRSSINQTRPLLDQGMHYMYIWRELLNYDGLDLAFYTYNYSMLCCIIMWSEGRLLSYLYIMHFFPEDIHFFWHVL